ncbi:MAG TPA: hypothetical protein VFK02_35100 [Kofleriaceae bacterium]|nr:hypothetical protein [Kofleriaceae bacterium]
MPSDFHDLFTWTSLATLGGGAAATFFVSNALQKAFNFNPKWLALVIAEAIAVVVALSPGFSVERLVTGVINGFVIYAAATGGTSIASAVTAKAPAPPAPTEAAAARALPAKAEQPRRKFFAGWWVGPATQS